MCGISGIIAKNNAPIQFPELQEMNDLIAHRGPDGEGFYQTPQVAFGHRRLAIIDLSQDGHQPMHFLEDYTITYNGEIYNYLELRDELKNFGYVFKTQSDTEVILVAYDHWKEDCVTHFNGMWAFAIHDKKRNIVFCSRDRFGVKPFYYKENDNFFTFGSEIKQLINKNGPNKANSDLIAHYLFTGMHDHDERTFFEGVLKLLPSHNLRFDLTSKRKEIKRFYTVARSTKPSNYMDHFVNGIKLRLRSDVKVGTCLSGGLDSSTVAAIAAELYHKDSGEKFSAIHAKSSEKETDESAFAIQVAGQAPIDLHIIEPTADDFKKNFDEVIYTQEEPFASPSIYLQYFVMKKASELTCKVMLDGQGGDETLLGYERYYAPAFATYLKDHGIIKAISEMISSTKNNSKMGLFTIIKYIAGISLLGLRVLYLKKKFPFLKNSSLPVSFDYWKEIKLHAFDLFKLQETELFKTNLQALLRYEDKNSMRHGVETRLPFIDYRAVESALNLPIESKIHNGWTKFVLRQICEKYLSKDIAWRKNKLGFNAPNHTWLSSLSEQIDQEIENSKILKQFINPGIKFTAPINGDWITTWRFLNIAAWERIYKVYV